MDPPNTFFPFLPFFLLLSSPSLCLHFDYSPFGLNSGLRNITYQGTSISVNPDSIDLTASRQNGVFNNSTGRVLFNQSVPLWNPTTLQQASFNTSFQFQISNATTASFGDGLAFFLLGPSSFDLPENSYGGTLALFNASNEGNSSNQIVAVEFDTYENTAYSDPDGNHVGIDVNSVISKQTASLPFDLKTAESVHAWIEYTSEKHILNVYVTDGATKPTEALLSYPINLTQYLPDTVYVGFSAATGASSELHKVLSWNFTSTDLALQPETNVTKPPESNPPVGKGKKTSKAALIIGLSILTVLIIAAVVGSAVIWQKRQRQKLRRGDNQNGFDLSDLQLDSGPKKFSYKELYNATKNFSARELLGQGGFGPVYKGILPGDGTAVAVKCISSKSKQGAREFIAEVSIISRIRHRHLVQLQGWCHEGEKLLLVYEYVPNGSLDQYLFSKDMDQVTLDWNKRYKIVCGLGAALQYLHEECDQMVIHRDVKASNVMLDARFDAKLGDFGLARQVEHGIAAHSTVVAGTVGYMAPEYYGSGKATTESDVYSYGAVLLEVGCGRRPSDSSLPEKYEGRLVDWVWDLYGQDRLLEAADIRLQGLFDPQEMIRLLVVGLACSHPDPKSRPTIRRALESLKGDSSLPFLPQSKPLAYYGPLPPKSIEEVLSETYTSSMVTTSSSDSTRYSSDNTHSSSSSASSKIQERPLLHK